MFVCRYTHTLTKTHSHTNSHTHTHTHTRTLSAVLLTHTHTHAHTRALWRITNVILCLIWIHVLTKRCRARQRCLRLFPDHLGLGQLCLLSMRSMTTERLNLYSANDFVLARCGFVRFIALRCMLSLMFCLNLKKVPPPILTIKIPCKNDLRWDLRWLQITTHVIE